MNETWPFRAGANDMELAQNITGAKLSEAGLSRKRRCNGMSETWCLHRGEGYGVSKNKTKSKPSASGFDLERRRSGMNETWPFRAGANDMELAPTL